MSYRLGVDIGGTFTDFALLEESSGRLAIHKRLTTPNDPARAVLDGIRHLLSEERVDGASVTAVVSLSKSTTNIASGTLFNSTIPPIDFVNFAISLFILSLSGFGYELISPEVSREFSSFK